MPRRNWIGTLSLLSTLWLSNFSLAAEPASAAPAPSATEPATQPAVPVRAEAFDLRGDEVRNIVRATAAAQSGSYRLLPETLLPETRKPDLAAALSQQRPAPRPEATPRLPVWQREESSCDGFISCGIDSLLGHHNDDHETEQFHMRQQKDRLMNQGSFTDSDEDIFKRPW